MVGSPITEAGIIHTFRPREVVRYVERDHVAELLPQRDLESPGPLPAPVARSPRRDAVVPESRFLQAPGGGAVGDNPHLIPVKGGDTGNVFAGEVPVESSFETG